MQASTQGRDEARDLLQGILDRHGWTPSFVARKARVSHTAITRFLGNPDRGTPATRSMGGEVATKVHHALRELGAPAAHCDRFLRAVDPALPVHDQTRGSEGLRAGQGSEEQEGILHVPVHVLADVGVRLASRDNVAEAFPILRYLASPNSPRGVLLETLQRADSLGLRIAAAITSAHLGQCYITRHEFTAASDAYKQALDLWHGAGGLRLPLKLWEPWQALMGRTPRDFELWCHQQIGVALRNTGAPRRIAEARGHLLYVVRDAARGHLDPRAIRANARRDLAMVKIAVNPTAPEAGRDLDESVSLLRDVDAGAILAISLLKRAGWHKAKQNWPAMERDVLEGVERNTAEPGVIPVNIITTAAEVYADLDPEVAGQLAHMAYTRAVAAGYEGQRLRAEAVLRKTKP